VKRLVPESGSGFIINQFMPISGQSFVRQKSDELAKRTERGEGGQKSMLGAWSTLNRVRPITVDGNDFSATISGAVQIGFTTPIRIIGDYFDF
jgi:hypothetical protein